MSYTSGQRSKTYFTKAKQVFPGGVNSPVRAFGPVELDPFIVKSGRGPYLFDLDGNRLVDYVGSWGPLVLGHADADVVQSIAEQAALGTSFGACCELELELAELVQSLVPNLEMLRFVSSGTEAGMSVLRLARAFTQRNKIIKFAGCYHGHTDSLLVKAGSGVATLSLAGTAGVSDQMASDTCIAEFNDLSSVEACFDRFKGEIAAIIIEPVMGNAGFVKPSDNFLGKLRELCDLNSSLLIFDEVMTGFRVALECAQGLYDVKPDLSMFGKVIGGGLPVGAFGGKREIMQMIAPSGPVYQAGTLSGNPLAMMAGKVTLEKWMKVDGFQRASEDARTLKQTMQELASLNGIPLVTDSLGSMFGFFFSDSEIHSYQEALKTNQKRFKMFFSECLSRGVYFAQSPFEAGFMSCVHRGEALDYTIRVLSEVFALDDLKN